MIKTIKNIIILTLMYFAAVICFVLIASRLIDLSEDDVLGISIFMLVLLLILLLIKKPHRRVRRRRASVQRSQRSKTYYVRKTVAIITVFVAFALLSVSFIRIKNTVNEGDIPEYLVEFGEKYPEVSDYVNAYSNNKDRHYSINLKKEVTKGTIPLFIQWDKRWGYEKYGDGLIGTSGCGPTCLSMVICGLTGNTDADPLTVANFSEEQGYYVSGEGTSWNLMTEGAKSWGLEVETGTVTKTYIAEHLSQNSPMICSMYPGDFTYTGHFIVLTNIDSDGNVIVNDPNSYKNSEKHWSFDSLLPQIRSLWVYRYNET